MYKINLGFWIFFVIKDKLLSLRNTVRILRYLTLNELGFSLETDLINEHDPNPQAIRQRAQQSQQKSFSATYTSRIGTNNSVIISKSKLLQ